MPTTTRAAGAALRRSGGDPRQSCDPSDATSSSSARSGRVPSTAGSRPFAAMQHALGTACRARSGTTSRRPAAARGSSTSRRSRSRDLERDHEPSRSPEAHGDHDADLLDACVRGATRHGSTPSLMMALPRRPELGPRTSGAPPLAPQHLRVAGGSSASSPRRRHQRSEPHPVQHALARSQRETDAFPLAHVPGEKRSSLARRKSGCPDSNWGPLRPERSALPGCATPRDRP